MIAKLPQHGPLKEYIQSDKFGVNTQESLEEARVQELANGYKDFELTFITGQNSAKDLKYTGEAAIDTASKMTAAQSSAQIKDVAST